jgi:hypothetical protein
MSPMPDDLPAALRDDPQAAVAFVTAEHFNLASADASRSAEVSDADPRVRAEATARQRAVRRR